MILFTGTPTFANRKINSDSMERQLKRKELNGKGTFDRIIHNIDLAVEYMPNCTIGVRTNIGIHNKDEYSEIYKIFSERWKGKNVNVYYAFILNNSLEEKKDNSSVEL